MCSRDGLAAGIISIKIGEEKLKKPTLMLCAALLVVLTLQGCATIRGMGEDIQSLGRAIKRSVS
jgi:predicted small secreted protein